MIKIMQLIQPTHQGFIAIDFAGELPRKQFRHLPAAVCHLDMRISAIGNQRVRVLGHLSCHISVKIERRHDRYVRPDRGKNPRQEFVLRIVMFLSNHCTMLGQQHSVEWPVVLDRPQNQATQMRSRFPRHFARWRCISGKCRRQVPTFRFGDPRGTCNFVVRAS